MTYFSYRLNRIAMRITLICFILSSMLFLTKLAFENEGLNALIIAFCIGFAIINFILLPALFTHAMVYYKDFEEHISTLVIVLLHLLISLFYLSLTTNSIL